MRSTLLVIVLIACRPDASDVGEWRGLTRMGNLPVREDVVFDEIGLTRATFTLPDRSIAYAPRARTVHVVTGAATREWSVPGDEPWFLAPLDGPDGPRATPLLAWASYCSARDAAWVRIVDPIRESSWVVPRDQVLVERTLIIGDEAVEMDDVFARSIAARRVAPP